MTVVHLCMRLFGNLSKTGVPVEFPCPRSQCPRCFGERNNKPPGLWRRECVPNDVPFSNTHAFFGGMGGEGRKGAGHWNTRGGRGRYLLLSRKYREYVPRQRTIRFAGFNKANKN